MLEARETPRPPPQRRPSSAPAACEGQDWKLWAASPAPEAPGWDLDASLPRPGRARPATRTCCNRGPESRQSRRSSTGATPSCARAASARGALDAGEGRAWTDRRGPRSAVGNGQALLLAARASLAEPRCAEWLAERLASPPTAGPPGAPTASSGSRPCRGGEKPHRGNGAGRWNGRRRRGPDQPHAGEREQRHPMRDIGWRRLRRRGQAATEPARSPNLAQQPGARHSALGTGLAVALALTDDRPYP